MYILFDIKGAFRTAGMWFDMISFSFVDNAYDIFASLAKQTLITDTVINQVLSNVYVLIGLFAFFRIAILLINSIISPDALAKKGAGLSRIFVNTVIMIILLVLMPTLFSWSRDISNEVVEKNYVQRVFLGSKNNIENSSPGKDMQRIAIGAIVTPNDKFVQDQITLSPNDDCNGDCKEAIECLQAIRGVEGVESNCVDEEGNVHWSHLSANNDVSVGSGSNKEYVYNYRPLILTIMGWLITYILLSFSFDVGKRMIELAVLEILSPLFVATIVDPKSMDSGPFKKWLKAVGTSYASLFIRIAAVSVLLLCTNVLTVWKAESSVQKLIVLISILIFCKSFPKWISDLIGLDGDGTGLGGLGIGKKIGGAALIGGAATKAGHAALGAAHGIARGAGNHMRNKKAQKDAIVSNELGDKKDLKAQRKKAYSDNGVKGWFNAAKDQKNRKREAIDEAIKDGRYKSAASKEAIKQGLVSMGAGAVGGIKAGAKAENLKASFASGKVSADEFKLRVGMQGATTADKIKNRLSDIGNRRVENAFGNDSELRKERDEREFTTKVEKFVKPEYRSVIGKGGSDGEFAGVISAGKFNKLVEPITDVGINDKDRFTNAVAAMTLNPGATITGLNGDNLTFSNGATVDISKNSNLAGRVFNDSGIANVEQMYLNRGNDILNEREQYNAAIKSTQSSINETITANAALRAFSVNIPEGGKVDLSFRSLNELDQMIGNLKTEVDSGQPKREDYSDNVDYERANSEYQKNNAIYTSLVTNRDSIRKNIDMASKNDDNINSLLGRLDSLKTAIESKKMDDVVAGLADAVHVDKNNVEGIRSGVDRATSKTKERIEAADKKADN